MDYNKIHFNIRSFAMAIIVAFALYIILFIGGIMALYQKIYNPCKQQKK